MNTVNNRQFSPAQQDAIQRAMESLMCSLTDVAPQLGPHFLSGGVINIACMSGANLKFGFKPRTGGLIIPGGIRPATGGIIK